MKKLVIMLAGLAMAASAYAGTAPGTGVVGSVHDMRAYPGAVYDEDARVCAYCHTPHHALVDPTGELQPLWSHQFTGYINNWIPYQSPTLDATIIDPLMGPSRLCMSCHDGVVAADQHYATAGNLTGGLGGDAFGIGGGGRDIGLATDGVNADFSNDHPIGFDYDAVATADAGIFPKTRTFINNPNAVAVQDVLMNDSIMTCATCHEVHNKDNVVNPYGGRNYLVYAPQDDSALCLTCHDKGNGTNELP